MATSRLISIKEYLEFISGISIKVHSAAQGISKVELPAYEQSGIVNTQLLYKLHNLPNSTHLLTPLFISTELKDSEMRDLMLRIAPDVLPHVPNSPAAILSYPLVLNNNVFQIIWMAYEITDATYEDIGFAIRACRDAFTQIERKTIKAIYKELTEGKVILNYLNPMVSINYVREVMSQNV